MPWFWNHLSFLLFRLPQGGPGHVKCFPAQLSPWLPCRGSFELVEYLGQSSDNPVQLTRIHIIADNKVETWMCLQEVYTKVLSPLSKQSFVATLKRTKARQRDATAEQRRQLWMHGAVKIMARSLKLLELSGLCLAVRVLTRDESIVSALRKVQDLPGRQLMQHMQPQNPENRQAGECQVLLLTATLQGSRIFPARHQGCFASHQAWPNWLSEILRLLSLRLQACT